MTFDHTKTYYKMVKADRRHYEHTYIRGLNVDHLPFAETGDCAAGGLYFTDAAGLFSFLSMGDDVAVIEVLPDARVVQVGNKWRANQVFIKRFISWKQWCKAVSPENLSVGGSLNLCGTKITALPENLSVGGRIYKDF